MKTKQIISYILFIAFLLLPIYLSAQNRQITRRSTRINAKDSLQTDSIPNDSVKKKKPLNAPVKYEAKDSIVFEQGGYAHLFGEGKVNYEKIELTAQVISMNMDSSSVYAHGVKDSLGEDQGIPIFKEGETPYETKAIRYNFKSKKGLISNITTQQGEGYVTGNNAKKDDQDIMYLKGGRYTTCDHHEHPHFYMQLTRAKVRPKKNIVTGPAYLVVADVPLPVWVPFFYFPFTDSYSSGFLMPSYVDDNNRGFGLRDGGYYFAVNDNLDLKLTGEIYTKGSWALGTSMNYNKRYKYSGTLQANYQVTKTGDKGLPDYSQAKDFKIIWSHRQDQKASPNSTFSAQVNFSTSSYERTNLGNQYNARLLSQNTKTSSVNYTRNFPEQKLSLASTFNIAQTMRDSSIAVTLPDLNITLSRIFPFKRKKSVGDEKWYEKISLSYSGRITNSIKTKDDKLFDSNLVKDWKNGMNHSIPISATFTLFKYLNITPSFNYRERWYTKKVMRDWNPNGIASDGRPTGAEKLDTIYGFHRVYDYNASLSMSTKMYGMYKPLIMKKKEIQIRHVFTPTVSISASPDFGSARFGYYDTYTYTDANGEPRTKEYSPYQGSPFGVPGKGKQGTINFDVSNNLEMKYKSDEDSTGYKKISLIDELGASMSYNTAAETKPWSDLSMRLRMKLSKNYTLNLNTSFATYAYQFDEKGNVYVGDRTEWSYGRFGRFQGWGSSFNYTFNNKTWEKWFGSDDEETDNKKNKDKKEGDQENGGMKKKKVENATLDSDGYQVFKMPWSLNIGYSFNIREDKSDPRKINKKTMRYPYKYTHNLNASGNIKLSNKWSVNFSTGYDFEASEITQTSLNISRDLHCWNMTCSIQPFGRYRSYSFTIRASAQILQDLKWEQRSNTQSNIEWY